MLLIQDENRVNGLKADGCVIYSYSSVITRLVLCFRSVSFIPVGVIDDAVLGSWQMHL